jgi:hypothetical protein
MTSNRRRVMWPTTVPHADATLREIVARVTAKDRRAWGFVLAGLRAVTGQSLEEQAAALGVSESALTFVAVCRLPRVGHRDEDLAAVSALVGIEVEVLRQLLAGASEVATVGSAGPNRR